MSQPFLHRHLPILLMIAIGAIVLLVAASEEPYHIDELRQVRSYDRDLAGVVTASIQQEQPPLDAVLNSFAQRVLGIGDVRQRLLSVIFGTASLALAAILPLRSGISILGALTASGVMALSPLLISVTAYARPYALPIFLMMTFLLSVHHWLENGRSWVLGGALITALLLPWSRTVEPVIFLAVSAGVLGLLALSAERRRRSLMMLGVVALGLASSVPPLLMLSTELGDRTAEGSSVIERLSRLGSDVPDIVSASVPYWPALLAIGVLAVALPGARRRLAGLWWWWIMSGTAVGFTLTFVVVAPVDQAFFARYLFTWVPAAAVLVGVVIATAEELWATSRGTTGLAVGLTGLVLVWGGYTTWHGLSTQSTSDWKAVSRVVVEDLPEGASILYDQLRPLGAYRTPFAGFPRYTKEHPRIPLSLGVIADPSSFTPGDNTAVVLLSGGDRVKVPGWVGIGVDAYFTVYLPEIPRSGTLGAAKAAEEFGNAIGPKFGGALLLTSASLWLQTGEKERAAHILETVLTDPEVRAAAETLIRGTALGDLAAEP